MVLHEHKFILTFIPQRDKEKESWITAYQSPVLPQCGQCSWVTQEPKVAVIAHCQLQCLLGHSYRTHRLLNCNGVVHDTPCLSHVPCLRQQGADLFYALYNVLLLLNNLLDLE
jgi:hypothetical protein